MSLTHIEIRNFQSLRRVELELGTFTVIVGPSSSGKSALMRACRALAANVRGSGVITRGQKAMAITARTDTDVVTLQRTEKSSSYQLSGADGEVAFTKLNGEVPQQVTDTLRLDPSTGSINFASQFDKPYLLDESGATIARQLGELTNVITIFEAVGQANRVRAHAASTLKTRKNDLDVLRARLAQFSGLSDDLSTLAQVEKLDARRQALTTRAGRLEVALRTLRIAEKAIEKTTRPAVPSAEALSAALGRYQGLHAKLRTLAVEAQRRQQAQRDYLSGSQRVETLTAELQQLLERTGVCPTCGQTTV